LADGFGHVRVQLGHEPRVAGECDPHVLDAVRWKWIEDNVAAAVKNEQPPMGEFDPFEDWDEIDAIAAELDDVGAALVVFLAGTGLRPEEAFGAEWRDVDLDGAAVTVRRAFAKGRLKDYPKTVRSRRRVPVRARVVAAVRALPHRRGILFPAAQVGGSTSTGSVIVPGGRRWGRQRSRTVASMTCATPMRRGVWRRGSMSTRWRAGWARAC
jgi:integrase